MTQMPHNLEAEEAILGAVMLDPSILADVDLEPEHFYRGTNERIFATMLDLHDLGEPLDAVTITERMKQKGEGDLVGGSRYLIDIFTNTVTTANYEHHCRLLKDLSAKREVLKVCQKIQSEAAKGVDLEDLVAMMDTNIEIEKKGSISTIAQVTKQALEQTYNRSQNRHDLSGISSGFSKLDSMTDGFQGGDLIILAARPSMGKTALAGQFALNSDSPVHVVSVEMVNPQLAMRMLSTLSGIPGHRIRKGMIRPEEMMELRAVGEGLSKKSITMDDVSYKLYDIRRSIIQAYRKGARLAIVDYIQLIENREGKSREREVGMISTMLKNTAKQLDIPVIALAQLSRNVESRENKRPILSDLRDSGQIEQDADIVMFLYRDGYYRKQKNPSATDSEAELIIAKGRNIGTDTIQLRWEGSTTSFEEYYGG